MFLCSVYLCVERIVLQLILALELPGVSLVHGQSVFSSLKDLGFINLSNSTPGKASFPADRHQGHPLPVHPQPRDLLLIRVVVEYQWKPKSLYFFICESIQGSVFFQVIVLYSIFLPLEADLKLQVDGMVCLLNLNHLHKGD